jgi:cytochrome c peroxidase
LFNGKNLNDSGRSVISQKAEDIGKFKTPSLRNVAITAPYMHNGMFKTLEQVIDFYNDTRTIVPDAANIDSLLNKPLRLTKQEKTDLKAFWFHLRIKDLNNNGSSLPHIFYSIKKKNENKIIRYPNCISKIIPV